MQKKATRIEVRSCGGALLFTAYVCDVEIAVSDTPDPAKPAAPSHQPAAKPQGSNGKGDAKTQSEKERPSDQAEESLMTDAQKRYLFRLLAVRGVEGEAAYDHLKKLFQVTSLQDVTKLEASRAIENMLETSQKGGARD